MTYIKNTLNTKNRMQSSPRPTPHIVVDYNGKMPVLRLDAFRKNSVWLFWSVCVGFGLSAIRQRRDGQANFRRVCCVWIVFEMVDVCEDGVMVFWKRLCLRMTIKRFLNSVLWPVGMFAVSVIVLCKSVLVLTLLSLKFYFGFALINFVRFSHII